MAAVEACSGSPVTKDIVRPREAPSVLQQLFVMFFCVPIVTTESGSVFS